MALEKHCQWTDYPRGFPTASSPFPSLVSLSPIALSWVVFLRLTSSALGLVALGPLPGRIRSLPVTSTTLFDRVFVPRNFCIVTGVLVIPFYFLPLPQTQHVQNQGLLYIPNSFIGTNRHWSSLSHRIVKFLLSCESPQAHDICICLLEIFWKQDSTKKAAYLYFDTKIQVKNDTKLCISHFCLKSIPNSKNKKPFFFLLLIKCLIYCKTKHAIFH